MSSLRENFFEVPFSVRPIDTHLMDMDMAKDTKGTRDDVNKMCREQKKVKDMKFALKFELVGPYTLQYTFTFICVSASPTILEFYIE